MKLKGYIKAVKENCFAIPIYGDEKSYYYHSINNDFKILNFEKTEISAGYFIPTYLSKTFEINSTAALIFVGFENFILCDSADEAIDEVIFFLKDLTKDNEYLNIKKEVFELKKTLINSKISNNEIRNVDITFEQVFKNEKNSKDKFNCLLDEYLETENYLNQNNDLANLKEKIIKRQIENSILDKTLFNENKEVLFHLFCNYLADNKSIFEKLIINTDIGKSFTAYLSSKSESFKPSQLSIEEALELKSKERRKNLKEFNYLFNFNYKNECFMKEPAYKRYGVDINYIHDNIDKNVSEFIIFIDDKKLSENISKEEIKKVETLKPESLKVNK